MQNENRIGDLVEYFHNWPSERKNILSIIASGRLDDLECKSIERMVFIIDRIGPQDLAPPEDA